MRCVEYDEKITCPDCNGEGYVMVAEGVTVKERKIWIATYLDTSKYSFGQIKALLKGEALTCNTCDGRGTLLTHVAYAEPEYY